MIRKLKNWSGWWDGLRSKATQAGAESLVTNLGAMIGSNGIAHMGIPGLDNIGINWKQAVGTTIAQFLIRVVFAAANYVATKPDPDVITETVETTHITKNETTGATEVGSSKTVITTPVEPPKQT